MDKQKFIIGNNLREIGNAMASGKLTETKGGFIPDTSGTDINCLNFSDTIIFWSNDDSVTALEEILKISFTFNARTNLFFFPVRGSLVHGELYCLNESMHSLTVNSVFGKGLIEAYSNAESLDWAGTVINESIISYLKRNDIEIEDYLSRFCIEYEVPYRNNQKKLEYALRLIAGSLNNDSYENYCSSIETNFNNYKKSTSSRSAKRKLKNTTDFLRTFILNN